MNINKKKQKNILEICKWLVIIALLLVAIIGNYYYRNINYSIRLLVLFFLSIIIIWLLFLTIKGKSMMAFIIQAKTEAKKVVWPTRQETINTTFIIIVITIFMSLIFWGLDTLLVLLISFFTNLRF